jgi:ABC-type transport system involved in multi-copper enzyme maturation permease subunit
LGVEIVSFPNSPDLLLWAAAPGALALTLGAFLLAKGWARTLGATLSSVGLSLISVVVLVAVAYGLAPFGGLAESPLLLLGVPLGVFSLALGVLLRRTRTSMLASTLCAAAGLAGLYWLGGLVLMQSACSFHSGGC